MKFKTNNDRKTHGEFYFDDKKWKVIYEGIHIDDDRTDSSYHYIVMVFYSNLSGYGWWRLPNSYLYRMQYAANNRLEKIRLELMRQELDEKSEKNE